MIWTTIKMVGQYQIGRYSTLPGVRWRLVTDRGVVDESSGAFYDGAHDHPEGAVAWCADAVEKMTARAA